MIKKHYPWVIAICAMMTLLVSNGMVITGITAFDEALIKEFGWSRGALKFRDLITFLLTGLVAPFMGIIIDKIGTRKLMIGGSVLLSLAYFSYSQIQSLAGIYLIHVLFAVVLVACGLNVAIILVSQWFKVHRGTAIGIALVGTSLGGVIFPAIIPNLIAEHGWRETFQLIALAPAIVLLLSAFVIRSHPSLFGMSALGREEENRVSSDSVQRTSKHGLDYKQALKTKTFWALSTVAMMTFYSMLAAAAHLFLHMRDMQFDPATAGKALSLMFGIALIGKFFFGLVADHLNQKLVFLANQIVMITGAVLLATLDRDLIWTALTIFGLGWGGLYTLLQLQAVNSFGLKAAGKILGTITIFDALGGGLGMWLTGVLFDKYGSYQIPFIIICVLLVIALIASTQIRKEIIDENKIPGPGSDAGHKDKVSKETLSAAS